ncbi:MAG: transglycosylase domain-containing protein [Acidimicrobiia bacterium]|nr:transglycosylase domain-containing protein [Acidimicrobiia bacterium]
MSRRAAGVLVIALIAAACAVEPIEDPGIGAGSLTSVVYAVDGTALTKWHAGEDRVLVAYEHLPRHLVDAVVAIEDQRFWVHPGVDLRAMVRAVRADLEAGEVVEGGSTITQQYIKNALLTPEVSLDRKMREVSLALGVEKTLSKQEIFERYINTVYFGNGAYGIGAAARRYFGKEAAALTLDESALLAGLIRRPNDLNPYEFPNAAISRRQTVLAKMVELGWLAEDEADAAGVRPLDLQPEGSADRSLFPYFTEEVRRRLLAEPALGDTPEDRFDLLTTGGLRIYTTLDPAAQIAAEAAVASVLPSGGPAAALAAVDPRTGHVLALVGGADYYDTSDPVAQFNLATLGRRQPGSAFKPFVLAAALEAGIGLDAEFQGGRAAVIRTAAGRWRVENFNQLTYPNLTLLEATVFSVNVVYARLMGLLEPEQVIAVARAAGINTPLEPLPSLALGTQEVTVLDMASAYATFAAGGLHIDPILVTRIEDQSGRILFEAVPTIERALDPAVAEQVTAALTEVVRRGTGQQAKIGRPVAGKTGTTEGQYDAWFVGYTPELAAAVWVGFPQGDRPLEAPHTPFTITGGTWPAQIWARFATGALSGIPYRDLPDADQDDLVAVQVDLSTGFLAGPLCPRAHVATVLVHPDDAPTVPCPIHNPEGLDLPAPGFVPAVAGRDLAEAVAWLEASGYQATAEWVGAPGRVPGTVLVQYPAADSPLSPGAEVALTVVGPEPGTATPDVLNLAAADARRALEAYGFVVRVVVGPEPDPGRAVLHRGQVWSQTPAAGEPPTGGITLLVNP